ncbi:hypothetical protein P153DRAFT_386798 [Dothidotthia symphoricarpi CBS 119687]|uniref:Uncharacterized protein n=1 Tax=Dothidotthia symphoricarpi CBS 119687 TaxID=1392245 RepID=A0A6A6ABT5_9PLEO|nr:uncharacterized protein P153DRAFT_386798 [Dothidotthia symphoricarpi CBS 119687]KAF2128683.1 hypothetical protein P153DRAFT_386798 [Dothidotthia symphoricarpi CBS 119687]
MTSTPRHQLGDFEEIKSVIEPFWHVWNILLQEVPVECIDRIVNANRPEDGMSMYTLYVEKPLRLANDTSVFPLTISPSTVPVSSQLQTAILKLNYCDFAVYVFLKHIAKSLQTIGARVDWLFVKPNPLMLIHYSDTEPDTPNHSVFIITSQQGERFIADFTIEQFGYPSDWWFKKLGDYIGNCAKNINGWWSAADDDDLRNGGKIANPGTVQWDLKMIIEDICKDPEWNMVGEVTHEQTEWIQTHVEAYYDRECDKLASEDKSSTN